MISLLGCDCGRIVECQSGRHTNLFRVSACVQEKRCSCEGAITRTIHAPSSAQSVTRVLKDKTIEYSKSRSQFGVPIGSFQALQHRMVDMLTACEQAQSLLLWAAMTCASGDDQSKRAVSSLKYLISSTGQKLGEEAVQLHGGMGVTWDLDVAHYFKRLTAIGQLFGNADWHLDKLAA